MASNTDVVKKIYYNISVLLLSTVHTCDRTAPTDTPTQTGNTERTCLAVEPTQYTSPHQTRQNSPVCVESRVAV